MFISLLIIVVLVFAYLRGARRGFFLTLMNLVGIVVLFIIANKYADTVSSWLKNIFAFFTENASWSEAGNSALSGSTLFYHGIAYWLIIILGGIIFGSIARKLNLLTHLPVVSQINAIAGGVLSLVIAYLLIFASLLILVGWPTENVSRSVKNSPVAMYILKETPIVSQNLYQKYLQQSNE
ncbi:CvpA family protein [Liquorilactobacillus uvarum]|uniref:CvpA family protein n=1 Tax=Liquorilactobacillus uvarum TaxID=303240 RepID=UPI00288BCDA3|nr:CvpA family protein [Liquorilactobacillus uvarum]